MMQAEHLEFHSRLLVFSLKIKQSPWELCLKSSLFVLMVKKESSNIILVNLVV